MKTGRFVSTASMLLCTALLVLSGVVSGARHASAQMQGGCPLSAGVTPPPAPAVTAQQVEDGSASLMAFVLAVRDQLSQRVNNTTEEAVYMGCLLRQEGSPYRSGSTYLVQLAPDRIFIHAKTMALSGRPLNPLIYQSILRALGINPADLASPATALAAFADAAAGNGGAFNAPDVPGASGYAATYTAPHTGLPIVLLAGFDLDASHVAEEAIDHGDPSVTAMDVVDRATLKAFVTQAGEFFLEHQTSSDPADYSKVRVALRNPHGPWRHGSVCLYILDLNSNAILFHAAFPDRFELRPLVPTVRDAVTGRLVLPQVIEAAKSSPEGGFVEYFWDDPADDSDSADIPKVGYAREFTGEIHSLGRVIPLNLIVGSGYYLRSPEVIAASRSSVVKSVLPQVMRAMTASTVDAVSGRIERATSGAPPATGFSVGGAFTLPDALLAHGRSLGNGTADLGRLLAGSSFTLALNAAGDGGGGPFGDLTFWGSGDWRSFSGGNAQSVVYDGDVTGASLGIDTKLGADMLAGVAVSHAQGTVDYSASDASGELTTSLTSINPYVGWQMPGGMNLRAMGGMGSGEVELDDDSAGTQASDLTQRMVAAGVSGPLLSSDEMIGGGTTNLSLKGEVAFTWADVEGSATIENMSLSASRQRLILEGEHVQKLASGATFAPSLEFGLRNDGGDGETGSSIEAGGALRYEDAESGLTVVGRVRTLLSHSGDYEETGVSGLLRIAPDASGRGLALAVEPAWGPTASGVQRLWESGVTAGALPDNRMRLNAEVGYGLGTAPGLGVVTPYAGLGLAGEGARSWRMGARWQLVPAASVSVEGNLHEAANDDRPEHGLMLRGALHW